MGEKMKNAPVYFAIAQARHNPVLRLGSYAADIQDRMRKVGYPDFKKGVSMAFNLMPQIGDISQPQNPPVVEQVERLMFFSTDNTKGFIVEQNALSFQTTEYDTFETFADEFIKGLGIVHECVTLAHSERIGLRYLDAIVPPNGEAGLGERSCPDSQLRGAVYLVGCIHLVFPPSLFFPCGNSRRRHDCIKRHANAAA